MSRLGEHVVIGRISGEKRLSTEQVLKAIRMSPGGVELLVAIHDHRVRLQGRKAKDSQIKQEGFCQRFLLDLLKMMGAELRLHSCMEGGKKDREKLSLFINLQLRRNPGNV